MSGPLTFVLLRLALYHQLLEAATAVTESSERTRRVQMKAGVGCSQLGVHSPCFCLEAHWAPGMLVFTCLCYFLERKLSVVAFVSGKEKQRI